MDWENMFELAVIAAVGLVALVSAFRGSRRRVVLVGALLAATALPALAMDDKQFEYLESLDRLCMRRAQWHSGTQTYEKRFERCGEIQQAYIDEFRRRQAAAVDQDLADITFYYDLYSRARVARRP